jgi:hypothetical protein
LIQITRNATTRTASADALADARARFEGQGFLKLPAFLEAAFLRETVEAVARVPWVERVHDGIGVELCAPLGGLTGALELACNDQALFDLIAELTGCGRIGCFEGRVYRMAAGTGHYDSWHSDVGQDRLVAMSVNLGREALRGGVLQIRRVDAPDTFVEVENPTPGDAVIFRIDPAYCHRVGPIQRDGIRTAYAGWFRARPEFGSLLRAALDQRVS